MRASSCVLVVVVVLAAFFTNPVRPQCLTEDDTRPGINPDLTGLADLGFNLYRQINPSGNFFFSPYSIWSALGMTYLGSGGRTETQLQSALGVTDKLNTYRLINSLRTISKGREERGVNFTFNAANRIYVNEGLPLVPCMRALLQDLLQTQNFGNAVQSAAVINQFIEDVTKGTIKDVVTSDDLAMAQMVLVNAVYFKGTWQTQFQAKDTRNLPFTPLNPASASVQVPMMFAERKMKYGESAELGARLVELPYSGGIISMYLLLPVQEGVNGWTQMVQSLNAANLNRAMNTLAEREVHLLLPKFKMETTIRKELKQSLQDTGLTDMFSTNANLTGFSKTFLKASEIIHKSFVEVSEEGTVASAATVVLVDRIIPAKFYCDRPFLFLIVDNETKNHLFMGAFQQDPRV